MKQDDRGQPTSGNVSPQLRREMPDGISLPSEIALHDVEERVAIYGFDPAFKKLIQPLFSLINPLLRAGTVGRVSNARQEMSSKPLAFSIGQLHRKFFNALKGHE
ncbi:MAG: hypothetical protein WD768_02685 [Phycisphaeraceae bacterium]